MRDKIFILITVVLVVLFGIQIFSNMQTKVDVKIQKGEGKEARYYRVIE